MATSLSPSFLKGKTGMMLTLKSVVKGLSVCTLKKKVLKTQQAMLAVLISF